jgi:DNA-binding transcriptional ArsR family regulator
MSQGSERFDTPLSGLSSTTVSGGAEDEVVIRDPRTIRALAHPARITVLHHLFAGEVLTATEFARLSGLTPSAMSYHLRALDKWGLITRAEPAEDGRERPWRALGRSIRVEAEASVAGRAAQGVLMGNLLDLLRRDLTSALVWPVPDRRRPPDCETDRAGETDPGPTGPPTVPEVGCAGLEPGAGRSAERAGVPMGFDIVPLALTDSEAEGLMASLVDLLTSHRRVERPAADTRRYHVFWAALPLAGEVRGCTEG